MKAMFEDPARGRQVVHGVDFDIVTYPRQAKEVERHFRSAWDVEVQRLGLRPDDCNYAGILMHVMVGQREAKTSRSETRSCFEQAFDNEGQHRRRHDERRQLPPPRRGIQSTRKLGQTRPSADISRVSTPKKHQHRVSMAVLKDPANQVVRQEFWFDALEPRGAHRPRLGRLLLPQTTSGSRVNKLRRYQTLEVHATMGGTSAMCVRQNCTP